MGRGYMRVHDVMSDEWGGGGGGGLYTEVTCITCIIHLSERQTGVVG